MSEKKLFLLDAFALIYRAYFAFGKNHRYTSKGLNTSAVLGFTNTLLEVLEKEQPTHMAVVFDSPEEDTRTKVFSDYKANRHEMPEDIRNALDPIKKIITGFGIKQVVLPGYEADDLIGTIVQKSEKEGFITYMMTPDKDFGQLVTQNTFIYKPSRGGKGPEILGEKEVCDKFGITNTKQVIDMLGLWGDAIDNIPGIPGIGEKTAKKLIAKYGSLENLLVHAHELHGKQKENIVNYSQQGILSKQLATIILNAPIDIDFKSFNIQPKDEALLMPLFEELELNNLARRIFNKEIWLGKSNHLQLSLFDKNPKHFKDDSISLKTFLTIEDTNKEYQQIKTSVEIEGLIKEIFKNKSFAFDTETTGLDSVSVELVGVSISFKKDRAVYIDCNKKSFEEVKQILEPLNLVFGSNEVLKIGQNIKYDINVLKRYGINFSGYFYDTMLAHYVMNPDLRNNLDYLSRLYLNYSPIPISSVIGPKGKFQKKMSELPTHEVINYACEDADITYQLYLEFIKKIDKVTIKLLNTLEFPLINVLSDMELQGIRLDINFLDKLSKELTEDIGRIQNQIFEFSSIKVNLDSPKQLGQILFEELKIIETPKKTKTGQYSTNESELLKLKGKHEIIDKVLEYRQLKKLKSTYVDALPKLVNPKTNKIHSSFMQNIAATGRLSSVNPNVQNIPIKTRRGRQVRKAFIAQSKDYQILSADYSQIELRIIAALSEDKNMIEAFIKNRDIHSETASKVFNVPLKQVDKELRGRAKAVNFGIVYGITPFGLSKNLSIKISEAKNIIESYFEKYPGIKDYMDHSIEFAKEKGYVETIMHRKRYIKDINSNNPVVRGHAERNAVNSPIQGSAADIIKIAMIKIHKELLKAKWHSKMIMQVHDELVFDVYKPELSEVCEMIKTQMEFAVELSLPLKVDMEIGDNWLPETN